MSQDDSPLVQVLNPNYEYSQVYRILEVKAEAEVVKVLFGVTTKDGITYTAALSLPSGLWNQLMNLSREMNPQPSKSEAEEIVHRVSEGLVDWVLDWAQENRFNESWVSDLQKEIEEAWGCKTE